MNRKCPNASAAFKDRMPYVVDGEKGPTWVTQSGIQFGLKNGMGQGGKEYVPRMGTPDQFGAGIKKLWSRPPRDQAENRKGLYPDQVIPVCKKNH